VNFVPFTRTVSEPADRPSQPWSHVSAQIPLLVSAWGKAKILARWLWRPRSG